jgi:hypothetical protein
MDSSSASVRAVSFASKGDRHSHLAFPSKAETEEKAMNIVQLLDDAVFKYLQPKLKLAEADKQKEIVKKTRAEKYRDARKWSELSIALPLLIETRYGAFNVSDVTADEVAERVVRDVRAVLNPPKRQMKFSENLRESVKAAFTGGEYLGQAADKARDYLLHCWRAYQADKKRYKSPYVMIAQSPGFGKSRLLYQLSGQTLLKDATKPRVRVLYTCMRQASPTSFPLPTKKLCKWLFDTDRAGKEEETMVTHLLAIYYYAQSHWATVGSEWLKVFTEAAADLTAQQHLEATAHNMEDGKVCEKMLPELARSGSLVERDRVVILAVDEANVLLRHGTGGVSRFHHFRQALVSANETIARAGFSGGIVGVLVDTNAKMSELIPSLSKDPTLHAENGAALSLFPPFVLSDTMDVYWDAKKPTGGCNEYERAITLNHSLGWDALVSMGRPLWCSAFTDLSDSASTDPASRDFAIQEVVQLAASKLLVGLDPSMEVNYNEDSKFGVASLLCRLGVRPYSRTTLASTAVADLMAVLAYVNHENESYFSTYASDPVLTFGAAQMWSAWRSGEESGLSKFILPHFKQLLLNETLDTGGIGEVVARIVLLLAMDTCLMNVTGGDRSTVHFTGQFVSVESFMNLLGGDAFRTPVKEKGPPRKEMADVSEATQHEFEDWISQWAGWHLGFSHFVQLPLEPTKETLRFLLGRRAAGMFPRNHQGVDLLIPIFREPDTAGGERKTSMILVQAKNRDRDSEFPHSATSNMSPSFVFNEGTLLGQKTCTDMIRIYMKLREERAGQFFCCGKTETKGISSAAVGSGGEDEEMKGAAEIGSENPSPVDSRPTKQEHVFTLCLHSLDAEIYPFIDETVLSKLADLASLRWSPTTLVEHGRRLRAEMGGLVANTKTRLPDLLPQEQPTSAALKPIPGYKNANIDPKRLTAGCLQKRGMTKKNGSARERDEAGPAKKRTNKVLQKDN